MSEDFTEEREDKLHSYLNIHLKKDELELTEEGQIAALRKRYRSKWWHFGVNFAVILLFAYSFFAGITELNNTIFIIIGVVFVINIGLIFYQMKQINELILYLEVRKQE